MLIADSGVEGMLVVEAPPVSEPASPENNKEETSSGQELQSPDDVTHGQEDQALPKALPQGIHDVQQIDDGQGSGNKEALSEEESIAAWQDT